MKHLKKEYEWSVCVVKCFFDTTGTTGAIVKVLQFRGTTGLDVATHRAGCQADSGRVAAQWRHPSAGYWQWPSGWEMGCREVEIFTLTLLLNSLPVCFLLFLFHYPDWVHLCPPLAFMSAHRELFIFSGPHTFCVVAVHTGLDWSGWGLNISSNSDLWKQQYIRVEG